MLVDAACRWAVYEQSPFSLELADRSLALPDPRRRLLVLLTQRPRGRAAPWLQRILGLEGLSRLDRVLAIQALPPALVDANAAGDGLEIFVISGRLGHDGGRLNAGAWLREPRGLSMAVTARTETTLYIKRNHLRA